MAVPVLNGYSDGSDDSPIVLHNLGCSGNEDTLLNCSTSVVPISATHSIDAGVYCFTNNSKC